MNARTSTPGSVAVPKNILCSLSALRFTAQERDKSNLNERTVHINRIRKFVVSNASSEDVLDALCAMGLPLLLMDIFQCEDYFILENGKLKVRLFYGYQSNRTLTFRPTSRTTAQLFVRS